MIELFAGLALGILVGITGTKIHGWKAYIRYVEKLKVDLVRKGEIPE